MQEVVCFDIKSNMAHFRKFYSNATSLSYIVPPRTVLCGIAAAIMGKERDSYYNTFAPDVFKCAVKILNPPKKNMQLVNYLMTKSLNGLNGSEGHAQVPLEILIGQPTYRLFFSHTDSKLFEELKERIILKRFYYPLYLGITEFIAEVDNCSVYNVASTASDGIDSVINMELVIPGTLKFTTGIYCVKDRMPFSFRKGRVIEQTVDILVEATGKRLHIDTCSPVYKIGEDNILFLEKGGLDD